MDRGVIDKLEIDVMQANELQPATDFAVKYNLPAMVIHPQLIPQANLLYLSRRGHFKIIVPVDWPKGEQFALMKMRGMNSNMLSAHGFEFMLTGGKSEGETRHEAITLSNFVRNNLDPMAEVRFVLGANMRPDHELVSMCQALASGVGTPTLVRNDHHLRVQATKGSPEAHRLLIERIRQYLGAPLKLSGNFATARSVASCPGAVRVAVALSQAQAIIKDLGRQPEALRELLIGTSTTPDNQTQQP